MKRTAFPMPSPVKNGETVWQGFDCLTWDYEADRRVAERPPGKAGACWWKDKAP